MWSGQTYQLVLEEARTGGHVSASCAKPILPNSPWLQNSRPNRLKISDYNHLFFSELQKTHTAQLHPPSHLAGSLLSPSSLCLKFQIGYPETSNTSS